MSERIAVYLQDPDESVEYAIDWSTSLGDDTISSSTWTYSGLTEAGSGGNTTTGTTSRRVSGGKTGKDYVLENTIVTAAGRTFQASILITMR